LRKRAYLCGILGILTSEITHRGENSVPFTRQGFREHSAEAGAGAGDENHLPGIHAYHSLPVWRYRAATTLMPEAQFGYKRNLGRAFPPAGRSGIAARSARLPERHPDAFTTFYNSLRGLDNWF
jgi:hypothetical protein